MIRGIHHFSLHTANFDAMVKFYGDAFGFVPVGTEARWSDEKAIDALIDVPGSAARAIMLNGNNCFLELFEYSAPQGRSDPPLRPNDRGYTHFCVDVTSIEEEFDRLVTAGMTFPQDRPGDLGAVKMIYGKDPDGNLIEIQEVSDGHAYELKNLPLVALER